MHQRPKILPDALLRSGLTKAQALHVQEKFHCIAVAVDLHRAVSAPGLRPGPMPYDVGHWLVRPLGLKQEISLLRQAPHVSDAEVIIKWPAGSYTAILRLPERTRSGPVDLAGVEHAPFGRAQPGQRVPLHQVSLTGQGCFTVREDNAASSPNQRRSLTSALGMKRSPFVPDVSFLGMLLMRLHQVLDCSGVNDVGYMRASPGRPACRVKRMGVIREFHKVLRVLVTAQVIGKAPDDDGRMIAVALYHFFELVHDVRHQSAREPCRVNGFFFI